jgi:hypothetical protein
MYHHVFVDVKGAIVSCEIWLPVPVDTTGMQGQIKAHFLMYGRFGCALDIIPGTQGGVFTLFVIGCAWSPSAEPERTTARPWGVDRGWVWGDQGRSVCWVTVASEVVYWRSLCHGFCVHGLYVGTVGLR